MKKKIDVFKLLPKKKVEISELEFNMRCAYKPLKPDFVSKIEVIEFSFWERLKINFRAFLAGLKIHWFARLMRYNFFDMNSRKAKIWNFYFFITRKKLRVRKYEGIWILDLRKKKK